MFLHRSFLVSQCVHYTVNGVVVRVLNAADRNSVIDTCLVDGSGKGVLGQLELCCLNQSGGGFVISLAGVSEQLPDLL